MSARIATAVLVLLLAPTLPACSGKKGKTEGPNDWEAAEPEGDMMSAFDDDEPPAEEEEGDAAEGDAAEGDAAEDDAAEDDAAQGDAAEGEEPAAAAGDEG